MFLINISKYATIGEHSTVCIMADLFAGLGEDVEVNARQLQYIFIGPESDHWECLSLTP